MKIIKKIWKIFDDYFSIDERKQIAELKLLLKEKSNEILKLKERLELLRESYEQERSSWEVLHNKFLKKINELNLEISSLSMKNKYYENMLKYVDIDRIRLKQKIYSLLDKNYRRILLEYNKRWVLNKENYRVRMMASDFVKSSSWLAYKFSGSSLEDIWKFRITYVSDNYLYKGCLDVWQLPVETYVLRKGDCDDSTSFRVAVAKSLGLEKDFLLFMAVGYMKVGNEKFGHAFPVMITKDGDWIVLEATSNRYEPLVYRGKRYEVHFLWDEENMWEVGKQTFGGKILKEFDLKIKDNEA